jgi:hypothetical protein
MADKIIDGLLIQSSLKFTNIATTFQILAELSDSTLIEI